MKKLITTIVSAIIIILMFGTPSNVYSQATVTDIDLAGLKTIFNSSQGKTRIIFIGEPTCPGCIASSNDLRNYIFNQCDNPDLQGIIIWSYVAGWSSVKSDAITASNSWNDSRVSCYWDSLWDISYAFGYQGGWANCNWAWDISMIYPGSTTWTGTYPPAPYYCISKTGCGNAYNITNEYNQLVSMGGCSAAAIREEENSNNYSLSSYPNPFSESTIIQYKMAYPEGIILITDVMGRKIKEYALTNKEEKIMMNEKLNAGIYFISLYENNKAVAHHKIIAQ